MAKQLACPACPHVLNVPDALLGQTVKCPECGTAFQTTGEGGVVKPELPTPASQTPAPEPALPHPADVTKLCPACRENIPVESLRCSFCGEDLSPATRGQEDMPEGYIRRDVIPHRGNIILLLGILSLVAIGLGCCPPFPAFGLGLGAAAWIMGNADLRRMLQGEMDPAGEGFTVAGRICGIIGVIMNGLYLLAIGAYMLAMLLSVWLGQMNNM
jgi:hypothetical protein